MFTILYIMESSISATQDELLSSLSFKLPSTANYIQSRDEVTYYPANGNIFSPTGVKIIRFMISGTQWLDPRSVRIQFKLNNNDQNHHLFPINHLPHNFFRRLRILAGGTLIEDIDYYNRVCNMIDCLAPTEKKFNDCVESFGLLPFTGQVSTTSLENTPVLFQGQSKVILMPLMASGLFNQEKYLPLRFMQGLQIELEVVNQFTDAVLEHVPAITDVQDQDGNPVFAVPQNIPMMSTNWSISEAQIKASVVTLDSALDNEYTDFLMQGKNIPIPLSTFTHQVQSIGQTDRPTLSMSRAFTRLNKVYITFYKVPYVWVHDQANPLGAQPVPLAQLASHKPLREANYFHHPNHIYDYGTQYGSNNEQPTVPPFNTLQGRVYQGVQSEVELQLQIGSKNIPTLPVRSLQESFYTLRKSILGEHNGQSQFNILPSQYMTYKYINVFDLQKVNGAFSSGLSTRTGDLITIKILNLRHVDANGVAWAGTYSDLLHSSFQFDSIMNITDSGVSILE